jgi:hypothetical protein
MAKGINLDDVFTFNGSKQPCGLKDKGMQGGQLILVTSHQFEGSGREKQTGDLVCDGCKRAVGETTTAEEDGEFLCVRTRTQLRS